MADFVETMKDWRRMCETIQSQNQQKSNSSWCGGCPLQGYCVIDTEIKDSTDNVLAIIEKRIRSWAEEHPEPRYPTWKEWLEDQRVVVHFDSVNEKGKKVKFELTNKSNCPIPAGIAQKLGIEPKEGT